MEVRRINSFVIKGRRKRHLQIAELFDLVQRHQHPKPSAIVQRFKFNTRFRKPGETIASYLAELRSFSEHCDFKTTLKKCFQESLKNSSANGDSCKEFKRVNQSDGQRGRYIGN